MCAQLLEVNRAYAIRRGWTLLHSHRVLMVICSLHPGGWDRCNCEEICRLRRQRVFPRCDSCGGGLLRPPYRTSIQFSLTSTTSLLHQPPLHDLTPLSSLHPHDALFNPPLPHPSPSSRRSTTSPVPLAPPHIPTPPSHSHSLSHPHSHHSHQHHNPPRLDQTPDPRETVPIPAAVAPGADPAQAGVRARAAAAGRADGAEEAAVPTHVPARGDRHVQVPHEQADACVDIDGMSVIPRKHLSSSGRYVICLWGIGS